jgi:hypothetical protein
MFATGSRLRVIGEKACADTQELSEITLPSSVEILDDRCFAHCPLLLTVTFEERPKLQTIGKWAFAFSRIHSFTVPESVNEIDGSAFVGCPLEAIDIGLGNRWFIVRESTLLTSDGTEIVRGFGLERNVFVVMEVERLQNSCFGSLRHLTEVRFENGSTLRKICRFALSGCDSLRGIVVPYSVIEIGDFAFKECFGLEECLVHKDSMLVKIGQEAFAECSSLRSLYIAKNVEGIGENCVSPNGRTL